MILHVMVHGADERHFVHHLGQPRQMLANSDAVGFAGGRFVRAANPLRRIGLHVEHVDVTRPAELIEENDGLGARLGRVPSWQF